LGCVLGCGAEAWGNSNCDRCQERQNRAQRKKRLVFKESNMCRECGRVEVKAGQYYCDECKANKFGVNTCCTDGCKNVIGRGKRFCDDCIKNKENAKQVNKVYFIKCRNCNKLFTVHNGNKKYCSIDCVNESQMVNTINRECIICGNKYRLKRGVNFDTTCSDKCNKIRTREHKRNAKDKRRIRKQKIFVEIVRISVLFKRDAGRCQICGKKLNLKRQVPHPLAATRDHIIPLSKGGEHSYKNTQLSCFKCNSLKGNRTLDGGEQLLLFGNL